jgi:hypothetical protein
MGAPFRIPARGVDRRPAIIAAETLLLRLPATGENGPMGNSPKRVATPSAASRIAVDCVAGLACVALLLSVAFGDDALSGGGAGAKWYAEHAEDLHDVLIGSMTLEAERAAITRLANELARPSRHSSFILEAFRKAAIRHPTAVDHVLPQLAGAINNVRSASGGERVLCEFCETVIVIGHGSRELTAAVEGVFKWV